MTLIRVLLVRVISWGADLPLFPSAWAYSDQAPADGANEALPQEKRKGEKFPQKKPKACSNFSSDASKGKINLVLIHHCSVDINILVTHSAWNKIQIGAVCLLPVNVSVLPRGCHMGLGGSAKVCYFSNFPAVRWQCYCARVPLPCYQAEPYWFFTSRFVQRKITSVQVNQACCYNQATENMTALLTNTN